MPPRSRPPGGRCRNPVLRATLRVLASLSGAVLLGLLPASVALAAPSFAHVHVTEVAHAAMGHTMAQVPLAQVSIEPIPTDASMAPLPEPKEVQAGPELRQVLEGIMCQCGCNLTAYACEGAMVCDVSSQMRADAELMLADGMSSEEVLETFAVDYGEGVLAAPRKSGFDLTAWVLPFLVLGVGGMVVAIAVRRWRPGAATVTDGPVPQADAKYVAEIERELEQEE